MSGLEIEGAVVREVTEAPDSSLMFVRVGFRGTDLGETILWVTNYEPASRRESQTKALAKLARNAREVQAEMTSLAEDEGLEEFAIAANTLGDALDSLDEALSELGERS